LRDFLIAYQLSGKRSLVAQRTGDGFFGRIGSFCPPRCVK
jgi:hypothetical protein